MTEKTCETCKHYQPIFSNIPVECNMFNKDCWESKEKLILRNQQSETMCEHEYIEKKVKDIRGNPCTEVRCKHCDKHIGFNVGVGTMNCEKCDEVQELCEHYAIGWEKLHPPELCAEKFLGKKEMAEEILNILNPKRLDNVFENEDDIQAKVCIELSKVCEMLSTETNNAEQKNKFLKHAEVFKNFSKVFKGVKQNEK